MRKILLAGLLAVAGLAALPGDSHAWGRDPYNSHGLGWLGSFAYRSGAFIHRQGPLFNYGPYHGPGHVTMHIPQPYHGSYTPADPSLWNSGFGNYGTAIPAPAAGYAPHAVPPVGPPQPYISGRPGTVPQPMPRITPASYDGVNPSWMRNR